MNRSTLLILSVLALAALNVYQYQRIPLPLADQEIVDRFTTLFFQDKKALWGNHYLGIKTLQNPMDVWITQELFFEVKPDVLVETGTHKGGSALLWSTFLEPIKPDHRIITIDISNEAEQARRLNLRKGKVKFLVGSSTAPEIVEQVREEAGDGRVMVILDSDHSKAHVLDELHAYAPLVSIGSYMIVQDGVVNGNPILPDYGPGPLEAVEEFLETNDQFVIDENRERLRFTYNPKGFLKRVR